MNDYNEKLTLKEEETMLLLWKHGPCSVKELLQHFNEPRPHINTLSSFVRILEKKGFVGHAPSYHGGFNYYAIKPLSEFRRSATGRFVKKYFGNCFSLVSQLVEDEQLDAAQLQELLDMVENRKTKTKQD